jgi:hypothetical protein
MRYRLLLIFLFSFFVEAIAKTDYSKKSKYYSNYHLNRIYKKVAKNCDVNKKALKRAFYYYKKYKKSKNLSEKYIAIADYTKVFNSKRLYIIRLSDGKVFRYKVAHGLRSGAKGGRVWRSSNKKNSLMTPYGFFRVGSKEGVTFKKKYRYLPIMGLEWNNKKVGLPPQKGGRDIIVHTANYVNYGGRSLGCFAIRPVDKKAVFTKLKRALLYSYTGK